MSHSMMLLASELAERCAAARPREFGPVSAFLFGCPSLQGVPFARCRPNAVDCRPPQCASLARVTPRCIRMTASGNTGDPKDASNGGIGDNVAERIATAFVAACTPSNRPYADQLADFCREVIQAYSAGFSLVAVQLEMASASRSTALGRALQSDEVELREVWLALVFKTLRHIRFPLASARGAQSTAPPEGFDRDRLDDFVRNIVAADAKGYDQKRIQLEQSLNSSSDGPPRTPLENAILQQSVRIVLTTLRIVREQRQSPPPPTPA